MKPFTTLLAITIGSLFMTSCSVIEGIFNVGMSVGIFISVFFAGIILFILLRFRRK